MCPGGCSQGCGASPAPRGLGGSSPAPEANTLCSPLQLVSHRSTAGPWHLPGSAKGKRSLRHPTAPRRSHHHVQGRQHPAATAPCSLCCGFLCIFIYQVLWLLRCVIWRNETPKGYRQTATIDVACFQQVAPRTHKTRLGYNNIMVWLNMLIFHKSHLDRFGKVALF